MAWKLTAHEWLWYATHLIICIGHLSWMLETNGLIAWYKALYCRAQATCLPTPDAVAFTGVTQVIATRKDSGVLPNCWSKRWSQLAVMACLKVSFYLVLWNKFCQIGSRPAPLYFETNKNSPPLTTICTLTMRTTIYALFVFNVS